MFYKDKYEKWRKVEDVPWSDTDQGSNPHMMSVVHILMMLTPTRFRMNTTISLQISCTSRGRANRSQKMELKDKCMESLLDYSVCEPLHNHVATFEKSLRQPMDSMLTVL